MRGCFLGCKVSAFNLDFLRQLGIEYPRVAVISFIIGVLFVLVLVLSMPYRPTIKVNAHPMGSVEWWFWYLI